jgi:hypothetical protein
MLYVSAWSGSKELRKCNLGFQFRLKDSAVQQVYDYIKDVFESEVLCERLEVVLLRLYDFAHLFVFPKLSIRVSKHSTSGEIDPPFLSRGVLSKHS